MSHGKPSPRKPFLLVRFFYWFRRRKSDLVVSEGDAIQKEREGSFPNSAEQKNDLSTSEARRGVSVYNEIVLPSSAMITDSELLPSSSLLIPQHESAQYPDVPSPGNTESSSVHLSSSVRVSSSLRLSSIEIESSPEGMPPMSDEIAPNGSESGGDSCGNAVLLSFSKLQRRMPSLLAQVENLVERGEFPLLGWGPNKPRILTVNNSQVPGLESSEDWIFIGDLHGDYYAWFRMAEILEENKNKKVCFLGDLVDRGPYSAELFAAIVEFALRYPDRLLWIVGNHDLAIQYQESKQQFISFVEPAEFLDWLNPTDGVESGDITLRHRWGNLFIDMVSKLPRVVLFGDGILASHGGIPLKDLWLDGKLDSLETMHGDQHLSDFTFNRAVNFPFKTGWKTASRRAVNHGLEFGYQDLSEFSQAVSSFFPFERYVRGHDHIENGFEIPERYQAVKLLTLNGFGFNHLNNSLQAYRTHLVYALGQRGQLPEIQSLEVDQEVRAAFYGDAIAAKLATG
jgi:hypothetical protein